MDKTQPFIGDYVFIDEFATCADTRWVALITNPWERGICFEVAAF